MPAPDLAPPAAPVPSGRAFARARVVAAGLALGLVVLGLAWELAWAPLPGGHGRLALKVLPLVLAMPGLVQGRVRTFRATSLLVWLYAGEGALRLATDAGRVQALAGLELMLALGLFAACVARLRATTAAGSRRARN